MSEIGPEFYLQPSAEVVSSGDIAIRFAVAGPETITAEFLADGALPGLAVENITTGALGIISLACRSAIPDLSPQSVDVGGKQEPITSVTLVFPVYNIPDGVYLVKGLTWHSEDTDDGSHWVNLTAEARTQLLECRFRVEGFTTYDPDREVLSAILPPSVGGSTAAK